ncbi:glycohydrolase toxin TNT-related protein [Kineococcus sp. T13]|uniref:glycohydrolase toxin TNT-related protein n=1 Tax=Kineococcus vitellinus TaxID=2696565 RepID=UPI001412009F|nr:glycohydrolase toxin TNT-related protein [Kineococcus vitellinus]NAZ74683.1 glycohydrolase toxin TNT-related protein [Kineococcus vitellinus]
MLVSDAGSTSLLSADPEALRGAAAALQRAGLSLESVGDSIVDHSFTLTANWSGPASTAAHATITKLGDGLHPGCEVATAAAEVIRTYADAVRDAKSAYDSAKLQVDVLRRDFLTGIADASPEDAATSRELFAQHSAGHLQAMSGAIRAVTSASSAAAAQIDSLIQQLEGMSPTAQAGAGSSGFDRFLNEVGNQLDGFIDGVVDGVSEPVGFVGGLIGLNGDLSDNWADFGRGLAHNVTHPVDFAKGVIGWEDLSDGEYGHWAGNLVPGAVATIFTGGAAAAVRGVKGLDGHHGTAPDPHLPPAARNPHLAGQSDGQRRELLQQLVEPKYHASNADIIEENYNPLGDVDNNLEFLEQYSHWVDNPDPAKARPDWNWPDNHGAVLGSEQRYKPTDVMVMDRIGDNPEGTFFTKDGTPFGQRSLPPDRLNFARNIYEVNPNSKAFTEGGIDILQEKVAPAFGQRGGGLQYQFVRGTNPVEYLSVGQLLNAYPDLLAVRPAG